MKRLIFIFSVLLILACNVSAKDKFNDSDDRGYPSFCVKPSEFSIGGISIDFNKEKVIAVKGKPTKYYPNDDDKYDDDKYDTDTEMLVYPDMEIEIFGKDHISMIWTTSPEDKTPSGISVGMDSDEVLKIIKTVMQDPDYETSIHDQFPICSNSSHAFILHVDQDWKLKKIEIMYDLP